MRVSRHGMKKKKMTVMGQESDYSLFSTLAQTVVRASHIDISNSCLSRR